MEGGPLVEDVRLPAVAASHRVVHQSAASNGNRNGGHRADVPGPPCCWMFQIEASLHKEESTFSEALAAACLRYAPLEQDRREDVVPPAFTPTWPPADACNAASQGEAGQAGATSSASLEDAGNVPCEEHLDGFEDLCLKHP